MLKIFFHIYADEQSSSAGKRQVALGKSGVPLNKRGGLKTWEISILTA